MVRTEAGKPSSKRMATENIHRSKRKSYLVASSVMSMLVSSNPTRLGASAVIQHSCVQYSGLRDARTCFGRASFAVAELSLLHHAIDKPFSDRVLHELLIAVLDNAWC